MGRWYDGAFFNRFCMLRTRTYIDPQAWLNETDPLKYYEAWQREIKRWRDSLRQYTPDGLVDGLIPYSKWIEDHPTWHQDCWRDGIHPHYNAPPGCEPYAVWMEECWRHDMQPKGLTVSTRVALGIERFLLMVFKAADRADGITGFLNAHANAGRDYKGLRQLVDRQRSRPACG